MGPGIQELPDLLKDTHYADPEDSTNTGIQRAWKTNLPLFTWFQEQPEKLSYFQHYLTMNRSGRPTFLDVYPVVEKVTTNMDPERALFVDVGGGYGTQAIAFHKRYPELLGKVVIEDLPETVKRLEQHPGVEALAQDFFQPQKIKGMICSESSSSLILIMRCWARCQVLLYAQHYARLVR
jgi:demethylsterigmatocystin 6-O-methyltransferase